MNKCNVWVAQILLVGFHKIRTVSFENDCSNFCVTMHLSSLNLNCCWTTSHTEIVHSYNDLRLHSYAVMYRSSWSKRKGFHLNDQLLF